MLTRQTPASAPISMIARFLTAWRRWPCKIVPYIARGSTCAQTCLRVSSGRDGQVASLRPRLKGGTMSLAERHGGGRTAVLTRGEPWGSGDHDDGVGSSAAARNHS